MSKNETKMIDVICILIISITTLSHGNKTNKINNKLVIIIAMIPNCYSSDDELIASYPPRIFGLM